MPSAPTLLTPPPTISALQVSAFLAQHRALESSLLIPTTSTLPCLWTTCPQRFDYAEEVSSHLHHTLSPGDDHEWCAVCDTGFFDLAALKRHRVISGSHVACPHCAKEYQSEGGMKTHVKMVHRNEGRLKCLGCGEGMWGWEMLVKHARVGVCQGMEAKGTEKVDLGVLDLRGTEGEKQWPGLPSAAGASGGSGGGVMLSGAPAAGKAAGEQVDEGVSLAEKSTTHAGEGTGKSGDVTAGKPQPQAKTAPRKKKKDEDEHQELARKDSGTAGTMNVHTATTMNLLANLGISGTSTSVDLGSDPRPSLSPDYSTLEHSKGKAHVIPSRVDSTSSTRKYTSSTNRETLNHIITTARTEAALKRKKIEEARNLFNSYSIVHCKGNVPAAGLISSVKSVQPESSSTSYRHEEFGQSYSHTAAIKVTPALPKLTFPTTPESIQRSPATASTPAPMAEEDLWERVEPKMHRNRRGRKHKRLVQAAQHEHPDAKAALEGEWLDPVKIGEEQRAKIRRNMMDGDAGNGRAANDETAAGGGVSIGDGDGIEGAGGFVSSWWAGSVE